MNGQVAKLEKKIIENIDQLISTEEFTNWLKQTSLHIGDLIVINNSVLYRSEVKTTKSKKYLGLLITSVSPLSFQYKVVLYPAEQRKNADFSHISAKSKEMENLEIQEVSICVEEELKRLGRFVFILIGEIDTSEIFEQPIAHSIFTYLVLDLSLNMPLKTVNDTIYTKEILDAELMWEQLVKTCSLNADYPNPLPEDLIGRFSTAVTELKKISHVKLRVPDVKTTSDNCFLDQIVESLKNNADEYEESLTNCTNPDVDEVEYNNILRISYTFADEIVRILRLLISVSDLKPLVFWLTIYHQFQLSFVFKNLPWGKIDTKADLSHYVSTIKGARNKAFHNLLQFNHTVDVEMDNVPLRATKLRLFSEFTAKGNVFEYEDKELVEILTEFTRAGEKYVSFDFWKRNLDVMRKTIDLLDTVSLSLKLLNE